MFGLLLNEFLSKSHDPRFFEKPECYNTLSEISKEFAYISMLQQINYSKMSKHWDSFLSHCNSGHHYSSSSTSHSLLAQLNTSCHSQNVWRPWVELGLSILALGLVEYVSTNIRYFVTFSFGPDLSYIIIPRPSMVFLGYVVYDIICIAFMTQYHIILNALLLFLLFLRLCHCTNSYALPHMFTIAMPFYNWTLVV